MQEIKITQYNKLIVNYDTYEFSPSNYKNIAIIDPWYIDVTSAPDFVVNGLTVFNNYTQETVSDEGTTVLSKIKSSLTSTISKAKARIARIASYTDPTQDYPDEPIEEDPSLKTVTTVMQSYKEINKINIDSKITIADDTYSLHDHYIDIYRTNKHIHLVDTPPMDHESLVKYVLTQMSNTASITTYDHYIRVNDYYAISKPENVTVDQNDAILYPYYVNYAVATLGQRQCIPRIQTITTTYDYQYLSFDLPAHQVEGYYYIRDSIDTSKIIDVAAGSYTFTKYINTLYNAMIGTNYGTGGTYMYQYPYMPLRRQSGFNIGFYGIPSADGTNVYNDMYCKLHCMWPQQNAIAHVSIMPANSRCLHIPSGNWTVDDLITFVNNNKDDCLFTLASTDHYIYIKADTPFIINPICKIITSDTDIAETFNMTHILLKNPMYQHFTAFAASKSGLSGIEEGDFTPAEFLRWIYNKTKVKFNIRNGIISYDLGTQLIIGNNPFFINNTDTGIFDNLCGLTTIPYRVVITGAAKLVGKKDYYDYNPVLEPYDYSSVNINNNITTTLNSANVVLMQ